ncbi:hypothetical protein [Enterococcus wangshanyuanii]|uniref:Novel STAND NTPase 3 domain-containing protein n=1 Tax=Enterococcus wangshanyuanii TaxID=2005703 RepID=A0ABQ1PII9_9ENTE|nr:hypothetical protein [Enterococcus wangshanyuanii]GGC97628.1 hypothetical protein GCM10011573_28960 [Enterococcus wangshanyuanii]
MSRLNRIQNEIKQLEGGRFQKLCDIYLYRKRSWENIVSLGSMEGTDKTTKGIPDTYFFDNQSNRYILVMYGTRADSTAKLEVDIKEAIEKTKIDKKDIQEIICCHTSSNLTVAKDKGLRDLAGSIELTLIGIDTLSHDLLQFKYQDIAKDFLGITESTEQVWNIEQFISIHDKSKTNAPLNTTYIEETDIIEEMIGDVNGHQILLLSGVSGTGKTKLAIEICKKMPSDSNVICVKSNSMPVYQDIKDALDNNRVNYLFLDDANTVTNFNAIVNLLRLEEYEQKLKIIITVRDYALSGIINQLKHFKTKIQKVSLMSDNQIEILINSINEFSSRTVRKIMKLSHNNPRIAVIAAKMVKEKNYGFIDNGKEILDSYYEQIIEENNLSSNEKVSLFILSFKHKLNLADQEILEELLKFFKLDFDNFLVSLNQLHDKELCDIFQNKAAKISDQSLSDFVIIDFIANNKDFKIRDFFINLFPKYEKEIVKMLVLVNNFKSSNDWIDYLTNEIKFVYNEVVADIDKERFLTQYGVLIPIEALAYTNEKIQSANHSEYQVSQKEFEEKKRSNPIDDPIIEILCSLSNSERFNDAGILLMEYLKKRQDKVYEVFSAIESNFDIEEDRNSYLEKRFCILEIFSKQENINELTALLIVNITEKFLKFSGEKFISSGQEGVLSRYTLVDGDYLIELHTKIFDMLFEVYNLEYVEVNSHIDKLLFNYPVYEVKNGFLETVSSDLKCIENLFFKDLSKLDVRQEAIVFKLSSEVRKLKLKSQPFFEYEPSSKQRIYIVFSSSRFDYKKQGLGYEKFQELRVKNLSEVFDEYSNNLFWLFNVLAEYQSDELLNKYELEESLLLLYLELSMEDKVKLLTTLLNSEFSLSNYHFDYYMEKLSFAEGKNILDCIKKEIDERWYLSNLLTCKEIDNDMVEELILFLKNLKNYEKVNSFNILSFESYIKQYTVILDILMSKYREGEVSKSFFIPNYVSEEKADKIVDIVSYKELKKIYLASFDAGNVDDSGAVFKSLLKENDANFIYLFLNKLSTERLKLNFIECDIQLEYIWKSEVAEEGIRKYIDFLIRENRVIYVGVDPYLEEIFKANIERASEFIKAEVLDTEDENRLVNLYNLSLEIFDDEILLYLFELLKDKDIDAPFIEKLYLTMRTHSWSGSLAPLLDKEIIFLNKLLDIFDGIKYISHTLVISKRIDSLKKQKEKELLADYLEQV